MQCTPCKKSGGAPAPLAPPAPTPLCIVVNNIDFDLHFSYVVVQFITAFYCYRYHLEFCQKMKIKLMDEMVKIMSNLHQYVPTVKYVEDCFIPSIGKISQVPKASLHRIIIGGDQLTAARARGAKKPKLHASSPISQLEGFIQLQRIDTLKLHSLRSAKFVDCKCSKKFMKV